MKKRVRQSLDFADSADLPMGLEKEGGPNIDFFSLGEGVRVMAVQK